MKTLLTFIFTISLLSYTSAQSVSGKLTLNGKTETKLELKTNAVVQLFKEFKTGKYQLKFNFESKGIPKNINKETIVLFQFKTEIYKDGKLVKNLTRKQPIPYFPGEMFLPAEAFDFIGLLMVTAWDDMDKKPKYFGIMPKGYYKVKLYVNPIGFKGEIAPIEFGFITS